MTTVSVDLAYRNYRDVGIAVLAFSSAAIGVDFAEVPLLGDPEPRRLAEFLVDLCVRRNAQVILLDGPQGWKDPENGLEHSRRCERALNTPAKTGLPGVVKPANYEPFVSFSILVFDALDALGWPRLTGLDRGKGTVAVESFPLSAWRSIGIPHLPSKVKARTDDITQRVTRLCATYSLRLDGSATHDQLQALVSGLAGIGFERNDYSQVAVSGVSPFVLGGSYREGYIVNPRITASPAACIALPKE